MLVRVNLFYVFYVFKVNIIIGKNILLLIKFWKKNVVNICDLVKKYYFFVIDDNFRIFLKLIICWFKLVLLLDDLIVFRVFF